MKHLSKYLSSVAIAALVATPVTTMPTEGWAAIDEIVVTTRKRAENLQDIPVAVAAFDSSMIEQQALRTTADVLKLVPGVSFDQGYGPQDTRITIRGINNSRGRASVAVLVDGIDVSGESISVGGGSSLLNTRLVDLERVEVIKGPQAALYGRNAFAGAINYVTKRPSMDGFGGELSVDVAEYGTYEVRGNVSGPVVQDKLALKLIAATHESDGFYKNQNSGQEVGWSEGDGIGLSALFEPTDTLSFYANVDYSDEKVGQRAVVRLGQDSYYDNDGNRLSGPAHPDLQWMNFTDTISSVDENGTILSLNPQTGEDFPGAQNETLRVSLIAEWDLDWATLKSTTGFLDNDSSTHIDSDFASGTALGVPSDGFAYSVHSQQNETVKTQYLSQEFTLSSNSDGPLTWLAGVNGFWEDTDQAVVQGGSYYNSIVGLHPWGPAGFDICGSGSGTIPCDINDAIGNAVPPKAIWRNTTSWSVFGLLGYEITDQLSVTGELRYIKDEIEVGTNTGVSAVDQGFFSLPIDAGGITLPAVDKVTNNALNPRLSIDYQANDDVLLYASVAKGTKPAGFGTSQFAVPADARMKEETLWAYELGTKTTWLDGALQANGAVFYNNYEDRQIGITVPSKDSGFPSASVTNAGEAEMWGAEIDILWQPTDELTIGAGYAYTDAEFTDLDFKEIRNEAAIAAALRADPTVDVATVTLPGPSRKDKAQCGNVDGLCDGAFVSGIAEHSANVSIAYQAPLRGDIDWFMRANGQYQSERPLENAIHTAFVDSHINVDAQIGVETDMWSVMLYANNLLDDNTVTWAQAANDFLITRGGDPRYDTIFAFIPEPRVVGLRASMKFGE